MSKIISFLRRTSAEGILTGLLWFGAVAIGASIISVGIWSHITQTGTSANSTIDSSSQDAFTNAKAIH